MTIPCDAATCFKDPTKTCQRQKQGVWFLFIGNHARPLERAKTKEPMPVHPPGAGRARSRPASPEAGPRGRARGGSTHCQDPERRKTRFLAPFPRKPLIRLKSRSGICNFLHLFATNWLCSAVFRSGSEAFRAGSEGIAFRDESDLSSEFNRGSVDAVADRVAARRQSSAPTQTQAAPNTGSQKVSRLLHVLDRHGSAG